MSSVNMQTFPLFQLNIRNKKKKTKFEMERAKLSAASIFFNQTLHQYTQKIG